ncbi:MAG: hypothetical protein D6683_04570 [Actinomyces sp.]|nr:MAG: hypothetical protein D6683_04570 [Actinomyces sp.]
MAERASGDLLNIHSHWVLVADLLRGHWSWWTDSLGLGYPVMKAGAPVFALAYLVAPAWYAPGLQAAVRTLTAVVVTHLWLRRWGLARPAALVGGLAYGMSGFLIGWGNWPHSNVAALAPALFWSVDAVVDDPRWRRGVPVGVVVAAMVWANFPQVTAYLVVGAVLHALVRLGVERRLRPGVLARLSAPTLVAGAVAVGLALPHLVGFATYVGWADTSHRHFAVDSSAGAEYLLTAVAPAAFGSDPTGAPWWGEGNWIEFQTHVGAPVVVLALFAGAAVAGDRRRRGLVTALAALVVAGTAVAYVGGVPTRVTQALLGDIGGLATRAKVLIALGAAGLAALGLDAWLRDDPATVAARRRGLRRALLGGLVVLVLLGPGLADWARGVDERGLWRTTLGTLVVPAATAVAVGAALVGRARGRLTVRALSALVVAGVAVELLAFALPVATVADPDQRILDTPSHAIVRGLLDPGERLAGEGTTFFPNTTQILGIDDLRGQLLKSPGYQAVLAGIDPRVFDNAHGGTPTYPNIQAGTDPTAAVWDAFGVGAWAQYPSSIPPGPVTWPDPGVGGADPSLAPVVGTLVVPPGGLRAVLIEVGVAGPSGGFLDLEVTAGDRTVTTRRRRDQLVAGRSAVEVFALAGEALPPGEQATVRLTSDGVAGAVRVATDADGALQLGHVAGADDGLHLVAAGPVTILERTGAAPVRLVDAAVVEPDPASAARRVLDRASLGVAVVDRQVGLGAEHDPAARLELVDVDHRDGAVDVRVRTDRAALVVVAVADHPDWQARVDGRRVEWVTADATLVGVPVPAGEHRVSLRFVPRHLGATLAVMILTALGVVVVLVAERRRTPVVGRSGR